jgi:hypothetical protein
MILSLARLTGLTMARLIPLGCFTTLPRCYSKLAQATIPLQSSRCFHREALTPCSIEDPSAITRRYQQDGFVVIEDLLSKTEVGLASHAFVDYVTWLNQGGGPSR